MKKKAPVNAVKIILAACLVMAITYSAFNASERRKQCVRDGGTVIAAGYMGRSFECRHQSNLIKN